MNKKIFVNLTVKDLEKTKRFFGAIGYGFNPQFTDQNAACMVISEDIYVMLVTEPFFTKLTGKHIADTSKGTECTVALLAENKEKVDEWAAKALAQGGTENPASDMKTDFMYGRSINDLDGHVWEVFWMDPKMIQK